MNNETPQNEPEPTTNPDGEPAGAQPATAPATAVHDGPRRLRRSRDERMLAGVCGGIAEYFAIDPTIVRLAMAALTVAGGVSIVLYLAAWLLVPLAGGDGHGEERPGRAATIAGAIVLIAVVGALISGAGWWGAPGFLFPLGVVALAGLAVWRFIGGARPEGGAREILRAIAIGVAVLVACFALALGAAWAAASGDATTIAVVVIATGVVLVIAGALGARARWLILPALAIALPAGVVSAADIDVGGGRGERTYRPAASADVRDRYELGAGQLTVDLRGSDLTPGDHRIAMRVGLGELRLIVPDDVCVATTAHTGAGAVRIFGRERGGVDYDVTDDRSAPATTARVLLRADVGFGAVAVSHDAEDGFRGRGVDPRAGNAACS